MSFKIAAWTLIVAASIGGVLLLNYWAAYQPLSTLVYSGIVLALAGLVNLVIPFRFLGVRKRVVGALLLAGGALLTFAALYWPAATIHVAQHRTGLDDVLPEYQFSERHSVRVHAGREQVLQAVRESTWGDMKSLVTLMKIRGAVLRAPVRAADWQDQRILDAFSKSGYLSGGSEHEIVMLGVVDMRKKKLPELHNLQEAAAYRQRGALKIGFNFNVEDAGGGWSTVTTETRVLALDETSSGMARYWRLIVPGSGLLRLQWLDGVGRRAESHARS
jgi:hypothetical protein